MVRASFGTWTAKLLEAILEGQRPFDRDAVHGNAVRDLLQGSSAPNLFRIGAVLKSAGIPNVKQHTVSGDVFVWRNAEFWRQAGAAALLQHLETGARPRGNWSGEVPLAIRRLAGDDDAPDSTVDDLLGNING